MPLLREPSLQILKMLREHWEEPGKGRPLSARTGGAKEKDWPKRPSDGQLQEVRKKAVIGPFFELPRGEAVRVPASQASAPPPSLALTGAELPQAKKVLHL